MKNYNEELKEVFVTLKELFPNGKSLKIYINLEN